MVPGFMGDRRSYREILLKATAMKKIFITLFLFLIWVGIGCSENYEPQNGDIIFQTSKSPQSLAIQKATNSKFSHMGIVYLKNNTPYVYEAIEPVKLTSLDAWIKRGTGSHFSVKRLSNAKAVLTPKALEKMLVAGKVFEGKHYDLYFEWTDKKIYCSELVWKIYKRALDIELGKLQKMKEFNLSDPIVQKKLHERFGKTIPKNETVISPAAILASDKLLTVYEQ